MKDWIRRVLARIKGIFVREEEKTTVQVKKKARKAKHDNWVWGDYASARHLLNDLQNCHDWLSGFKPKMSEEGLRAIKKLGVYMYPISGDTGLNMSSLDGGRDRPMPTYMAVAMNHNDGDDEIVPMSEMIVYAEKHKWRIGQFNVERPRGGTFYTFGCVYKMGKKYYPVTSAVEVVGDGDVRVLRALKKVTHRVSLNGTKRNRAAYEAYEWTTAYMPPSHTMEKSGETSNNDLESHTKALFAMLYNISLRRDASAQIHATKEGTRMVFTVPFGAWKVFFKDRITAKATDGKRKRIFHHVAAHKRAGGSVVRMHTRGETDFTWEGFNVQICDLSPGRGSFSDFDFVGDVMDDSERRLRERGGERLIGTEEVASMVLREQTKRIHGA